MLNPGVVDMKFVLFLFLFSTTVESNWKVETGEVPLSDQFGCYMVSSVQHSEDGQSGTPVRIVFNGTQFVVETESNLDLSYPDIGLQVDQNDYHKVDRLFKKVNAVFDSNTNQILDEFIRGLNARMTLGFWPSWPVTKSYQTQFNLRGFTRTYNEMVECQLEGSVPKQQ